MQQLAPGAPHLQLEHIDAQCSVLDDGRMLSDYTAGNIGRRRFHGPVPQGVTVVRSPLSQSIWDAVMALLSPVMSISHSGYGMLIIYSGMAIAGFVVLESMWKGLAIKR